MKYNLIALHYVEVRLDKKGKSMQIFKYLLEVP